MTDITKLAQREKFEAWWEREYKHLEFSKYTDSVPHIKYGFWMAYQAGGAELVEALEKAQSRDVIQSAKDYHFDQQADRIAELDAELEREREKSRRVMSRIAELESRTVKLPDDEDGQAYGFGKWANGKLPATAGTMTIAYCEDAWRAAFAVFSSTAGIKVEADSLDADVNDRNQPGMVVAVHIDVGDFVKFRGRVYEVKETDFDDHDVTLWFVCGEVLKCAACCPIEVVSAPVEDEWWL
ncbi:TPA: hypothetical protein ACNTYI_003738 [Klebsiella pneumoniae]|uniref:hypothetical protein n=1 Tax=Klebsiella pneumoniae complex TaxID=3390273 RepID=UPI0006591F02|nr:MULTISPECIES: hypothetical protein [Klebsiella]KMG69134.1 hypothetical protein SM58_02567 [Klebsiella pneumoniae]STR05978.1 Uncharacterised protein [Klebsiella quasipneumoniae]